MSASCVLMNHCYWFIQKGGNKVSNWFTSLQEWGRTLFHDSTYPSPFPIPSVSEQILIDTIVLGPVEDGVDTGGGTLSGAQRLTNNPEHLQAVERTALKWLHIIGWYGIALQGG